MRRLRMIAIVLLLACGVWAVTANTARAAEQEERSLERIEKEIEALWAYADNSQAVSDDVFYPAFAKHVRDAQKEIAKTEKELATTKETRETKKAVERLHEDVQQIQIALIAWHAAAEAKDTAGFEDASFLLQSIIEIYNEDVDAYNDAAHGGRALAQLLAYIAPALISFALSAILLAVAAYYNEPSDSIIGEIRRQLRWHLWLASLFLFGVALLPVCVYLFADNLLPGWGWLLIAAGMLPILFVLVRFVKLRRLAERP